MAIENARDVVLAFLDALNREDFPAARKLLHDDMSFDGVMGSRHGAESYITDMTRMRFKYEVRKALADDTDVSLFYDINMSGKTIFAAGWYSVQQGKIRTFRVVFDPRPLLADKAA